MADYFGTYSGRCDVTVHNLVHDRADEATFCVVPVPVRPTMAMLRARNIEIPSYTSSNYSLNDIDRYEEGRYYNDIPVGYCLSAPRLQESDTSSIVSELVRRNNREVDKINRSIHRCSRYRQVHPKMKRNGTYPKDFSLPRTVGDFEVIDTGTIDRILISYDLPGVSSCLLSTSGYTCTSREKGREAIRQAKLCQLFEFLGADYLVTDALCGDRFVTWS